MLSILCILLVLGIVFFQSLQGLFSAMIMALATLVVTLAAFTLYEPLAALLAEQQPLFAEAGALVALMIVPLLVLRFVLDKYLPGNVVPGVWVDRVGGGLFGLVTALLFVGTLLIAMQMLPWGRSMSIWGFDAYGDDLSPNNTLLVDAPAFTLGTVKRASTASMKGAQPFASLHDNLVMELWATRNRWEEGGKPRGSSRGEAPTVIKVKRNLVAPKSLSVQKVYDATGQAHPAGGNFGMRAPVWPLDRMASEGRSRVLVVRASVDNKAADGDRWWRLMGTHFRLVTRDGASFYPVGYLIRQGPLQLVEEPVGKLQVNRPCEGASQLTVDWVYRVPHLAGDQPREPWFMAFRRIARDSLPAVEEGLPTSGGLQKKVIVGAVDVQPPEASARGNFIIKARRAEVSPENPVLFTLAATVQDGAVSKSADEEQVEGQVKGRAWYQGVITGRLEELRKLDGAVAVGMLWQPSNRRVLKLRGEPPQSGAVQGFGALKTLTFQPQVELQTGQTLPAVGAWLTWKDGGVARGYLFYEPEPSEEAQITRGTLGSGGGPLDRFIELLTTHANQIDQCGLLFLVPPDATVTGFRLAEGAPSAYCVNPMKVSDK